MPKKDYNMIVFMSDGSNPRKYRKITDINDFYRFADRMGGNYFNVYDRTTKLFVERIYIKKGT